MWSSTRLSLLLIGCVVVFLFLVGFSPAGLPYTPEALFSDAVTSHWSAAFFTRHSVLLGEYPLWRDTILAGGPFAANPLNKTTYPLQWLVLILPPALHLNVLFLLHAFIGAAGMWRWARSLGIQSAGAALSVLAYGLAPKVMGHLGAGHLDVYYALAWIPWLMWLIESGVQGGGFRYVLKLALVAALVFLADVRISLFVFLFAAAYLLWVSIRQRGFRQFGWSFVAVPIAFALVAALLFPLLGWQPFLSRNALTLEAVGEFSVEPLALMGLIIPAHSGGYETMTYLGLTVLVLMLIGLASLPRGAKIFWGVVLLVAVLWAMGIHTPFWRTLAQIDALRWFRVPGRAWFVVMWSGAVLAGFGLDKLCEMADRWRESEPPKVVFWLRLLAAGSAGLLVVCGLSLLVMQLSGFSASAALMLILIGIALAGVLMAVLLRRGRGQVVAVSLLLITFADLAVTGVNWVEWRGPSDWLEPYLPLASRLMDESPGRIYSPSYALPQQVAELADLELFYGVDPFQISGLVRAIEAGSRVPVEGYSVIIPPLDVESEELIPFANQGIMPDLTVLAQWNVSHVIAVYWFDDPDLTYVDTVNGVNIFRNEIYTSLDFEEPDVDYGLPTADTISRLNRITIISVWVSALSFVLVGFGITLLEFRSARDE